LQLADAVARGIGNALCNAPLSAEHYDAIAPLAEAAADIMIDQNLARREAGLMKGW
jgi:hypothetical protein